jgi:phosphate transport system substrate-binding protein
MKTQIRTLLLAPVLLLAFASPHLAAQNGTPQGPMRLDGHRTPVDPAIPPYDPVPPMFGTLKIVGSGGLNWQGRIDTLVALWVGIFQRAHPNVQIQTALFSTPSAPLSLVEQTADVGVMTREPMPSELYAFRNKVFKPIQIPVAGGSFSYDEGTPSICIIVNKDNPLKGLTLAQLDAIYSTTRKRGYKEDITTWGQLGLSGDWADKPIHLYGLQPPDGIPNYMTSRLLLGGEFKPINEQHQDAKGKGMDYIAARVGEDRYGIGYVNRWNATGSWEATAPMLPKLKLLGLAENEGDQFSFGSYEDVLSHKYPCARYIYLYVNKYPDKPLDPAIKEFVRAMLSKEGQEAVARTVYMPLPWSEVSKSLAKIPQ